MNIPSILIIAGSDSSGGAGIQADIKTAIRFRVYPATVVTAVTAQNTRGVVDSFPCSAEAVEAQLAALLKDLHFKSVKSGMIPSAEIASAIKTQLLKHNVKRFVLDPVIASQSGYALIDEGAISQIKNDLIKIAFLITPNIAEGEVLAGLPINNIDDAKRACEIIHESGVANVLLKGGHADYEIVGPDGKKELIARDILYDGKRFKFFDAPRIEVNDVHGTGCSFATAIAAGLAKGQSLEISIRNAKHFISEAIRTDLKIGHGYRIVNQNFKM